MFKALVGVYVAGKSLRDLEFTAAVRVVVTNDGVPQNVHPSVEKIPAISSARVATPRTVDSHGLPHPFAWQAFRWIRPVAMAVQKTH